MKNEKNKVHQKVKELVVWYVFTYVIKGQVKKG